MTRRREKFPEWLAAQPAPVQDHVLGSAKRGQAYRDGTLKIDRYTDRPGRYTLDDLAASRPEELPRLGVTNGPDKEE
jgi:hypothetical protein